MADLGPSFFVRIGGKQFGPLSGDQLREMVACGTLHAEDAVQRAGGTTWHRVETVKWLSGSRSSLVSSDNNDTRNGSVQTQPPSAAPLGVQPEEVLDEHEKGHLVRNVAIVAGGITFLLVALLIGTELTRDRWELHNAQRVSAKLDEADQLQRSEPLTAFKLYDELLKEAQQHKVTDERFLKRLASAEKSRSILYPKVEKQIRAEEAEKQRQAEEEAKRAAEEKQRIAQEEERKRAVEKKKREEEKRLKEAIAAYRNVPQSARTALNAVKKVEARTEVGINYKDYSTAVGEAWGEVKIFVDSPEGRALREFSLQLVTIIEDYKLALGAWDLRIEKPGLKPEMREVEQLCWSRTSAKTRLAESLLDGEKVEKALESIPADHANDERLKAALDAIAHDVLKTRPAIKAELTIMLREKGILRED